MVHTSNLRTELGKVKGLGSAKHGVSHWWYQRLTALAIIPFSLWFMCSLVQSMLSPNVLHVAEWFSSPVHAVGMVVLLIALFFHGKLGVQVIVEDYVHSPFVKYALLLANNFLCILLAVIGVLAVLKLHFLDVVAGSV